MFWEVGAIVRQDNRSHLFEMGELKCSDRMVFVVRKYVLRR